MFTGIVEEVGEIRSRARNKLTVAANLTLDGSSIGDSISVNGACMTITSLDSETFDIDMSPETISRTNLGISAPGDKVNLERPLAYGSRVGGHLVEGHVDGTGRIVQIAKQESSFLFHFTAHTALTHYIVEKGFVSIDGVSFTIVGREDTRFSVSVIPYTYSHTTIGIRVLNDSVNIEVDILAKYIEQLTSANRDNHPRE